MKCCFSPYLNRPLYFFKVLVWHLCPRVYFQIMLHPLKYERTFPRSQYSPLWCFNWIKRKVSFAVGDLFFTEYFLCTRHILIPSPLQSLSYLVLTVSFLEVTEAWKCLNSFASNPTTSAMAWPSPLKVFILQTSPQSRVGYWEAIWARWGHEGRAPMGELCKKRKRDPTAHVGPSRHVTPCHVTIQWPITCWETLM